MRKEFDENNDEEMSEQKKERAKMIAFIVPILLIVIVLIATLVVQTVKKNNGQPTTDELQESIKEYADGQLPNGETQTLPQEEKATAEPEQSPTVEPTMQPTAQPTAAATPSKKEVIDYSKISFDKDEQLAEMMAYWADNNQKALDDLANLDRFKAMSYKLNGITDYYYYGEMSGDKPNGKGIAVYADNQYYYGDWQNGVRSGDGSWMHYHMYSQDDKKELYTFHSYVGAWANDLPNGEGSEHYDYIMEHLKANMGYNTNLIGSYKNGLYDGSFYITNIYSDGNIKEWDASATNGSWNYINENKDTKGRRTVQVENVNPDNYIWMYPKDNLNLGVSCLISAAKN